MILRGKNLTIQGGAGHGLNHAGIATGGPIAMPAIGGEGSINIEMNNSIFIQGTSEGNKGSIAVWSDEDHEIKVIAGKDIFIGDYGMIKNLSTGKTILVTDHSPLSTIGSGSFYLSEKGEIISYDTVHVYAANPSNVTVKAKINESLHSLPPYSTDQHRFATYYPQTYSGGPSFVFYYKTSESGYEPNGAITYGIFLSCLLNSEIFYMLEKPRREDIFNVNPYSRFIQRYRVFSLINSLDEYQAIDNKFEEKIKLQNLWVDNTFNESKKKTKTEEAL